LLIFGELFSTAKQCEEKYALSIIHPEVPLQSVEVDVKTIEE
jgi:fructose-bisphosphate aldolase class 1